MFGKGAGRVKKVKATMNKRGFTLVEMLIVMVIIAIVASIVLPRVLGARQRANETNTRNSLDEMRKAVKEFEADCGAYPATLADITARTAPSSGIVWVGTGTGTRTIDSLDFHGPYLDNMADGVLPVNLLTHGSAEGTDWIYNTTTMLGMVSLPPGLGNDSNGFPYSNW